jgi:uncharacterized protein
MELEFRWNAWNVDHIAKHGVKPGQVEYVVRRARPPFPHQVGDEKFIMVGPDEFGLLLRVIYIADPDETAFVIHAMPLTDRDKKKYRRRVR